LAPKSVSEFEVIKRNVIRAASETGDAYIQNWTWWVIGWDEMFRGRMNEARDAARELMRIGQLLSDPRSTGFGLNLLSWIAFASDSYAEALDHSEHSLSVAVTPWDRVAASLAKGDALMALGRTDEAIKVLQEQQRRIQSDGDFLCLVPIEPFFGVYKLLQGNIGEGIRVIEETVSRREREGHITNANFWRLNLAEVYLRIIAGSEKPSLGVLLKNLPILLKIMVTGSSRIRTLMARNREHPSDHPDSFHTGKVEMILGLLYKIKKKRALALQHLTEARRILSQFGQTPILARVETALAELGQQP
jgi:tetratricopeptide (TPR) repeat protein